MKNFYESKLLKFSVWFMFVFYVCKHTAMWITELFPEGWGQGIALILFAFAFGISLDYKRKVNILGYVGLALIVVIVLISAAFIYTY